MAINNPFAKLPPISPRGAPMATTAGSVNDGGVVVPSDTVLFPVATSSIWVDATGNITMTQGGQKVTLNNVPVGWLDVACTQVWATGTTITRMVAYAG